MKTLLLLLLLSATLTAAEITDVQKQNLKEGLKSANEGLKVNCIYYIGKYEIKNMKQDLIDTYWKSDRTTKRIILNVLKRID